MKSEFGKGFVYNLILFASHFEREIFKVQNKKDFRIWFNGASDHLYELEIPKQFKNTEIGKKAKELQDLSLEIGHGKRMMNGSVNEHDFNKVVKSTGTETFVVFINDSFRPLAKVSLKS